MLIKEYRIPLPLSVEEYRIAQLYMIQKKSREESRDTGSGVEIIENKPYIKGPGGSGQYTYKIYHIGSHLPGWFRAILPKSALTVEEEAWNAYPYTKTRYRCPFVEKFLLEIETRYLGDCCDENNVFDMSEHELSSREVDVIDIVRDPIGSGDYKPEEDPRLFHSSVTRRGPLEDGWRDYYVPSKRGTKPVMTAYKLCRVEFKYWGMQNKIERFIHDVALRRTMLRAHRQAWCWQDEYHGLTIDDIRHLERETQLHLAKKMAASKAEGEKLPAGEVTPQANSPTTSSSSTPEKDKSLSTTEGEEGGNGLEEVATPNKEMRREEEGLALQREEGTAQDRPTVRRAKTEEGTGQDRPTVRRAKRQTRTRGGGKETSEWGYQHLEQLQESDNSEEEYFDAQLPQEEGGHRERGSEEEGGRGGLVRTSSMDMVCGGYESCDTLTPVSPVSDYLPSDHAEAAEMFGHSPGIDRPVPGGTELLPLSPDVSAVKVLFLVLHGGNILESAQGTCSKPSDFATLQSTFAAVMQSHYQAAAGHVVLRLVPCPQVCCDTLGVLSSLSPYSHNSRASEDGNLAATQDFVPLGAIALFASSSSDYHDHINAMVCRANAAYHDFLRSSEGRGFAGQVCLLADSTGSLLAYDALTRTTLSSLPPPSPNPQLSHDNNDNITNPYTDPDPDTTAGRRRRTERSQSEVFPDHAGRQHRANTDTGRLSSSSSYAPSCRLDSESSYYSRRRASTTSFFDGGVGVYPFDFEVTELFCLGSPLGLVLAYRRAFCGEDKQYPPARPTCQQVYNLFHSSDPMAIRLEPLLSEGFKHVSPVKVPRYSKFPLGDGQPVHVVETIQSNLKVLAECRRPSSCSLSASVDRKASCSSVMSTSSGLGDTASSVTSSVKERWWGTKRLDYVLYCPEALHSFPTSALTPLFHSSFWESADVVAFILRQVVRQEVTVEEGAERGVSRTMSFKMTQPREKWLKRRTTIKVRNLQQNHRGNDVIVLEDKAQTVQARFMYGSLDIVSLSGEKVDINVMRQPPAGDWIYLGTALTDSHGKLTFTIPDQQRLSHGVYPVKCVVRGDHTSMDLFLAVLPPKTETVVFSIDGSFTASVSITGTDPKVRAGAVDVVRHWQDLGYLILYVSARPDMQHRKVVSWLAQHNFPHGMVAFMDGLSKDPLRQKLNYLKHLQTEADVHYSAAYGSGKDIHIYRELGLQANSIFIVGKASKRHGAQAQATISFAQFITDGYAAHLSQLMDPGTLRPATGNARLFLRKSCFRLPGHAEAKKTRRTVSNPAEPGPGKRAPEGRRPGGGKDGEGEVVEEFVVEYSGPPAEVKESGTQTPAM